MGVTVTVDDIPDECLVSIFRLLPGADRKNCSLVCRRWLKVEGQTHHQPLHLTIPHSSRFDSVTDLSPNPKCLNPSSLFSRFDFLTDLTLKCPILTNEILVPVAAHCPNLTRLQLRECRYLTYDRLEVLAKSCKGLKKFSFTSCVFGPNAIDALIHHCTALEELSLEHSHVTTDRAGFVYSYPLIRAKNLTILKIVRCSVGEYWDRFFHSLATQVTSLVEVHLDMVKIGDIGLRAISKFSNLEILHLVNTYCTDAGLVEVAEGCNKSLRKLRIGGRPHKIGDQGLTAVAKCCPNLQQLVLIDMNPSKACLPILASKIEVVSKRRSI